MIGARMSLAMAAATMLVSPGTHVFEITEELRPANARRSSEPPRRRRVEPGFIAAPVGRNHPDYGLSLAQHLARKAQRKDGK